MQWYQVYNFNELSFSNSFVSVGVENVYDSVKSKLSFSNSFVSVGVENIYDSLKSNIEENSFISKEEIHSSMSK